MTAMDHHIVRDLEDFAGIASDWFWETNADHRFTYFSSRMEDVTKLDSKQILGQRRTDVAMVDYNDPKWQAHLDDLYSHRPFRNFDYAIRRPFDGSLMWLRIAGQPLFDADGTFCGYRGTGHDITPEKIAMQKLEASNRALAERNTELAETRKALERSANEDALTGLLNRRAFERDLQQFFDGCGSNLGLLHVDLDRFKWVNDTLGHAAGDAVLVTAAKRLSQIVGEAGKIYRVGGDEFQILLIAQRAHENVRWFGEHIVECMRAPFFYDGHRMTIGASVGIALVDETITSPRDLIDLADGALYQSKRSGRDTLSCAAYETRQERSFRRQLSSELPKAIEKGAIVPFFQPQVNALTGRIVGAEALVRWKHPRFGILKPGRFLDIAATLGLSAQLDRAVLRQTLRLADRLPKMGLSLDSIAVNTSAGRLIRHDLLSDIRQWWLNRDCQLSIELLETLHFDDMHESSPVTEQLRQLRDLGVRIEIDDFGSGRASLTGLLRVRPDRIKIDRNLIQAAARDPMQQSVVAAIFDMARALGLQAMAEGVETAEDVAVIRKLGCEVFQGFYYARPLPEEAFCRLLAEGLKTKMADPEGLPRQSTLP
ncbi:putative bifunctional diguanylate cyclase/phosphodiesterase [Yoonia litorea]|uniref:PAS domain S-box-containing protein/diguanylate cyclase (GGDEF) domain-containing protein n=1 Tax=Yoonia litorea TaxID=1123755 RepID=A0A1I6N2C4_9RHOB|nr:GGDEF and EAL domain-containing protein [Yoonia litorea]SFS22115.1 PAS domain S-box-containing protein/diguanylate cyclase (GGDEF) domain-containing protein [Yoonia litorea]